MSPACHPGKDALDKPAPRQNLKAFLPLDLANNFDNKIQKHGLVHQLCTVIVIIILLAYDYQISKLMKDERLSPLEESVYKVFDGVNFRVGLSENLILTIT